MKHWRKNSNENINFVNTMNGGISLFIFKGVILHHGDSRDQLELNCNAAFSVKTLHFRIFSCYSDYLIPLNILYKILFTFLVVICRLQLIKTSSIEFSVVKCLDFAVVR